jgi:hypothetical protein
LFYASEQAMIMMRRLTICVAVLGIALTGCATYKTAPNVPQDFEDAPKILNYGAVDRIRGGQTWRVFLAAEDPNGDMDRIVFRMRQPGGQEPYRDFVRRLQREDMQSFSGYFYLYTPRQSRQNLWGLTLTLTARIWDQVGYASEEISLPLKFVGSKVEQPVPEGFTENERAMGPIMIRLYREGDGGRGRFR